MQVLVHDNVLNSNQRRERFIMDRIEQQLEHFSSRIHRLVISLTESGHGPVETRCHIAASLGPLGTVVVDARRQSVHEAVSGAVRQLTRSIGRRVERRVDRRPIKPR
ncbi:hypothetical protein GC176_13060 [bacterium]|nr:hypothetical protein [bacterium]